LIQRLNKGAEGKLTLISAPAGYGKTVLASIWADECACPVAWLSLDDNDNDLGYFLNYFINAVQIISDDFFAQTKELVTGQQLPSLDIIATRLVNEAAAFSQPILIILDDFHVIVNQEIHQLTRLLIQYLPAQLHLVILTRQDPTIDIFSMRVKSQVNEIRLAELRFSEVEAEQYLRSKLGENVSQQLTHEIYERTEGWAAGLRLAVLALRSHDDQQRFIETFQGTNQHIMSYLLNEVLAKRQPSLQTFLLQTSLFDRFSVALCDAVLPIEDPDIHAGSQENLNQLLDWDLFIISLDTQGEWFRYHHLFQELLRYQLNTRFSEKAINQLHRRASSWFADQGFLDESLDHAFLAGDMDLAAEIVARARFRLMEQTQWQRLEQLLHRFPQDFVKNHPDLLMAETWLHYQKNQLRKLPSALERLEELIRQRANETEEYRYLVGEISALRSFLLYFAMDSAGVKIHAEQALNLTAPELGIVRVLARLTLACSQQMAGDLNDAYTTIYRGFDEEQYQSGALKASVLLTACFPSWLSADLRTLRQNAAQVGNLSQKHSSPGMLAFGHYFLGTVNYHQNDLSAAKAHFNFVHKRPYTTYDDSFVYSSCGLALTFQAMGREKEALEVVEGVVDYLLKTGNSEMLPVMQAFQAELAVRQGQLTSASQWANRIISLLPLMPMPYFYAPHKTLAKVLLAENTPASLEKAAALLVELKGFLEFTHNDVHLIETLALLALYHEMKEEQAAAIKTIKQALSLGLPGRFVRVFVDLGPDMEKLLSRLSIKEQEFANYWAQILAAFAQEISQQASIQPEDNDVSQPSIESLTNREMDVLVLLSQRLTDKEIAGNLVISHATVRSHTRNIYAKLGVNNRRQAAVRAQELSLI
jgi:LuxR family maltose regulon positive regulatory protein